MIKHLNKYLLMLTVIAILFPLRQTSASVLSTVVLSKENGGLPDGNAWDSSTLKNKINLILYVDPDKKSDAEPLVNKLDSLNYSPDLLNITFILNTAATIIPNFIIRNRVKKQADKAANITYVLDEKKVLVEEWDLADNDINVLLLDSDGSAVINHHGKMDKQYLNRLIQKINNLINKGETK